MSFTRTEVITIAKILEIDRIYLENHIAVYPTEIDSTVEDAVRDEITRWTGGIGTQFYTVQSGPAGFKGVISAEEQKDDVRKNIRNLLLMKDAATSGSNWGYSKRG